MNPLRTAGVGGWVAVALCVLILALLILRGCGGRSAPVAERPTASEARATVAAGRGATAAAVLLGQADGAVVRADSLSALLAFARARTDAYRDALLSARARTDSARTETAPADAPLPPVLVALDGAGAGTAPLSPFAALLATERASADAALSQCESRAALSDQLAEAQRERSVWAYAAADSALAARASMAVAYSAASRRADEADARASSMASLAGRYRTQRNLALAVTAGALGVGCAVLLTR